MAAETRDGRKVHVARAGRSEAVRVPGAYVSRRPSEPEARTAYGEPPMARGRSDECRLVGLVTSSVERCPKWTDGRGGQCTDTGLRALCLMSRLLPRPDVSASNRCERCRQVA